MNTNDIFGCFFLIFVVLVVAYFWVRLAEASKNDSFKEDPPLTVDRKTGRVIKRA